MLKKVKQVIPSQLVNMGGIILDQPLPYRGVNQVDPFLLLHHWSNTLEGGRKQDELGVGPHPHRGFSPVTFVFKGGVLHQDTLGVRSEVFSGGVQWMNSGRGIVHSERPVKELAEFGGDFEIIQLWINTPVKNKLDVPAYIPLHKRDIPAWCTDDKLAHVHVVCGVHEGIEGPVAAHSPLQVFRLELKKGAILNLAAPESHNSLLYLLNGEVETGNERVIAKDLVLYTTEGDLLEISVQQDAEAIFLSGEPLNEPMFSHGPFVMDSQQAIVDAINDFQSGSMGTLKEKFD